MKKIRSEETIQHFKEAAIKRSQDPEWIRKHSEAMRNRDFSFTKTPEHLQKMKIVGQNNSQNPEWRRKIKESAIKRSQDPEWQRKRKEMIMERRQEMQRIADEVQKKIEMQKASREKINKLLPRRMRE